MIELFIKEKRLEKNLSQRQLADLSGISKTHIGDLERNEREATISVLCMIAKALNVKPEELYKFYEE